MRYLTTDEIAARRPHTLDPADRRTPIERLRERMRANGQWHDQQNAGRAWPIGCVSLEITQRCNLDCTLCYLSEVSEAVKDVPIEELFRRIDMIFAHYGPRTDIQVSGGEPTLRKRDELVRIVHYIQQKGMRSSLFTNGIHASCRLLRDLAAAGLNDVAFHVDVTQQRKGYTSEVELNRLRRDLVERARGLGLKVFFNTTVCAENFKQIPEVVAFFVANADVINLGSFQLQADTGRGVLGQRDSLITPETLAEQIRAGTGCKLNFDATDAGHARCNRYAFGLVTNGRMHDALDNPRWVNDLLQTVSRLPKPFDRSEPGRSVWKAATQLLIRHPRFVIHSTPYLVRKALQLLPDGVRGGGRVNTLAFFIHNFMDACHLEADRVDACVFMAATQEGPLSMCLYNAKRDHYLLKPVALERSHPLHFWHPLTGKIDDQRSADPVVALTRKTARGRAKQRLERQRTEKG